MDYAARIMDSPVGALTLVARDAALAAILWPDDDPLRIRIGPLRRAPDDVLLLEAERQLRAYFAGTLTAFSLPLAPHGTPFQRQVWAALLTIPFGETRSYSWIGHAIGRPSAIRAVGAANGRNPISIVIPCHRVIGSNGTLTGFAGGLAAKARLLDLEGATRAPHLPLV